MYGKLSSNLKWDSFWESTPCQSFAHTFSKTCFRIQVYKYNASAKIGNICFIWKVPEETDQVRQHQTVREVEKLLPMFETRLEAKYLCEKYENIATVSPILRRNIVEFLTGKVPQ